jgi:hypothetical protein
MVVSACGYTVEDEDILAGHSGDYVEKQVSGHRTCLLFSIQGCAVRESLAPVMAATRRQTAQFDSGQYKFSLRQWFPLQLARSCYP